MPWQLAVVGACTSVDRRATTRLGSTRMRRDWRMRRLIRPSNRRRRRSRPARRSGRRWTRWIAQLAEHSSCPLPPRPRPRETCRPAARHASRTCRPDLVTGQDPQRLGKFLEPLSEDRLVRPQRRSRAAFGMGKWLQASPASSSRLAKPSPRQTDQGRSPHVPTNAKWRKPRSTRCSAARPPPCANRGAPRTGVKGLSGRVAPD